MENTSSMTPLGPAGVRGMSLAPEGQPPLSNFPLYVAHDFVRLIFPPLILLSGTIGNVLTIVIMRRLTSADGSVIHVFFTATAVGDLLCLVVNTLDITLQEIFGLDLKVEHRAVCKAHALLFGVAGTVSCWYLVCVSLHRAMAVVWPHRVHVLCTRRTAHVILGVITAFNVLLFSHFLFGFDITPPIRGRRYCFFASRSYQDFLLNVFVYVDLLAVSVLPFVAIMAANCVLVRALVRSVTRAGASLSRGSADRLKAREKDATSVTLTVLTVSLTFLALTLPFNVNYIVNFDTGAATSHASPREVARGIFVTTVCDMLRQANSAVNFYLYVLTGRRFRQEFFRIVCCRNN
ncbi:hypothetical protein ACOMHN_015526 [Nucella lapillus]